MLPSDIVVSQEQASNNGVLILVEVRDDMEYQDGKPTGKRLGTRYSVVAPAAKYRSFSVKVPDTKPIITQAELDQLDDQQLQVVFEGFSGRFYYSSSQRNYGFSARADKIVIV